MSNMSKCDDTLLQGDRKIPLLNLHLVFQREVALSNHTNDFISTFCQSLKCSSSTRSQTLS
ncbi:unnamed protein product [Arabidopsis halleri]